MDLTCLNTADLAAKTVLVRVDYNLPKNGNEITDTTRLALSLPTIKYLIGKGAKIVLLSHYGNPMEVHDNSLSLRPMADKLALALGQSVDFIEANNCAQTQQQAKFLLPGSITLLENLRFYKGETSNDMSFAQSLASYGDLYVNDAFSISHRRHASMMLLPQLLPSYIGFAAKNELQGLTSLLNSLAGPRVGIIGGAKASTKLKLIESLLFKLDKIIIAGAMANTFLAAMGENIGSSLHEPNLTTAASVIMDMAKDRGCELILPVDVSVASDAAQNTGHIKSLANVGEKDTILDIGPKTIDKIIAVIKTSKTVIWNGALGKFEKPAFNTGTLAVSRAISSLTQTGQLISIAGGGDTITALQQAGVIKDFTYVSSGGGALLHFVAHGSLPAIDALSLSVGFSTRPAA